MLQTAVDQRVLSKKIYAELCEVIPGGVNSPVRAHRELLDYPLVAEEGRGDRLIDSDGNEYIDYCMSWGALIHGHAPAQVVRAAELALRRGSTFGVTTAVEGRVAKKIAELVPSVEKIRFVSSGTEATMSAIRLARGATGRSGLVKFSGNYHGHADYLLVQAGSGVIELNKAATSKGILPEVMQSTHVLPFNNIEVFRTFMTAHGKEVAAVIVEPIAGNMGTVPGTTEFINALREETEKQGVILIFDEVMTGFRVAKGGAQALYGIKPDLTCFSKIIGGGFPAGAFGGRADLMNHLAPLGEVYQAGTLSGNPVAMSAALAALELLDREGFYEELEKKSALLTDPIIQEIKEKQLPACLQRVGSMFTLFFGVEQISSFEEARLVDKELFGSYFRFMLENGVFIPPSPHEAWFVSAAHTEESLYKTADLTLEFLKLVK